LTSCAPPQDRLIQNRKARLLGQLTAGIAHEIKNPLNFVNNFAALSAELTDELNDMLKPAAISEKIRDEVDQLTTLLKDNLEKVVQHGKARRLHRQEHVAAFAGRLRRAPACGYQFRFSMRVSILPITAHAQKKGEFNITVQRDFDADAGTIELFPQEITAHSSSDRERRLCRDKAQDRG